MFVRVNQLLKKSGGCPGLLTVSRLATGKGLLLVCMLCLVLLRVNAQHQPVALSFTIGQSNAELLSDRSETSTFYDMRDALHLGGSFEYFMAPNQSLVAGLEYVSEGGQLTGMQLLPAGTIAGVPGGASVYADLWTRIMLHYLEVPVMYRYVFGREYRFHVEAGPFVGVLMGGRKTIWLNSPWLTDRGGQTVAFVDPETFSERFIINRDFRRINLGLTAGVGHFFEIDRSRISYDARYSIGALNIQRKPEQSGRNYTGCLFLDFTYSYNFYLPKYKRKGT